LFQHGAAESCFAGADFACELNEALSLANSIEQVVVRFAMLGAVK